MMTYAQIEAELGKENIKLQAVLYRYGAYFALYDSACIENDTMDMVEYRANLHSIIDQMCDIKAAMGMWSRQLAMTPPPPPPFT